MSKSYSEGDPTVVQEISQKQISDYIKLLVEFGGVYKVDSEFIIRGPDSEPVQIMLNKKAVPIKIFNDRMMTGDWVFLNPFKETLTVSGERTWFWQSRSMMLGYIIKRMLEALVDKLQSKEDDLHIGELELAQQLVAQVDDKTRAALTHLSGEDYGVIFYHKKSKTAQFQCRVLESEYHETFKSKLRKKDWAVITTFMETVLQTAEPEKVYVHTGTNISMMEAEATLHVLTKVAEAIAPYSEAILKVKLPILDMLQHLSLLDKYCRLTMWHQPAGKEKSVVIGTKLPWEIQDVPENVRMPGSRGTQFDPGMINNRGIRMAAQLLPSVAQPPEVKPLILSGAIQMPSTIYSGNGSGTPIIQPVMFGGTFMR
jgi:hypothetical protein